MKNTWIVGLFLLAAISASAETVSSVSFNPSRLGNFEKLKVSGAATLRGGLTTPELNIGGQPTVVDRSESGDVAVSDGATITMTATQPYAIASVASSAPATSYNRLNVPLATFRGLNTSGHDYTIATNSFHTGSLIPVDVNGGTLDFSADSFVNRLVANNNLVAYAKKIMVGGTLKVTGETSTLWEQETNGKFAMEGLSGFKLGNITIPYPSAEGRHVQFRPSSENEYVSNPSLNMDTCKLAWIKRKVNTSDPSAEYVLGFTDNGSTHCVPTCADGAPIASIYKESCGAGYSDGAYKKWKTIEQLQCNGNNVPEKVTCFVHSDGSCTDTKIESEADTSECVPSYSWKEIDRFPNTYESHWAWVETGWDFWFFGTHHVDGIDDTRCAIPGGPRLWRSDSLSTIPSNLQIVLWLTGNEHLYIGDTDTTITLARLIHNRVKRPIHSGDKYQNAPTCDDSTTNMHGQTVDEAVYALWKPTGAVLPFPLSRVLDQVTPDRCDGVMDTIRYKCMR